MNNNSKHDISFSYTLTRDTQHSLFDAANSETCHTLHRTGLFEVTSTPLEL